MNKFPGSEITIIVGYLYLVLAYLGLSSQIESRKYISTYKNKILVTPKHGKKAVLDLGISLRK